jgi:GTP cyclohydrolase I
MPQSDKRTPHLSIEKNVEEILRAIGEDPQREGLLRTPTRVAKSYEYLTSGYRQNIDEIVNEAIFNETTNGMIIARDIEVYSLCEHHILPFYGKAHIAYIPNGKIIGLSKIPRIVDMFARRLQVQERLTVEIQRALQEVLQPAGVAVAIKCKHMCMMMRGVEKQNSEVVTSSVSGIFESNEKTRMEFLSLIHP